MNPEIFIYFLDKNLHIDFTYTSLGLRRLSDSEDAECLIGSGCLDSSLSNQIITWEPSSGNSVTEHNSDINLHHLLLVD